MFEALCEEDASVSWLAEPLPMALSVVMAHIHALEKGGLIRTYKSGRVRTCCVEPQALRLLYRWISEQHGRWERRQTRA